MKRYLSTALLLHAFMTYGAFAQDSYDAARFASSDLNGTARYVGMGGALGALGGDISVMSTNPAGTGLFRSNEAMISLGLLWADDGVLGKHSVRPSIDNIGLIISSRVATEGQKGLKYINYGVNYTKRANYFSNLNCSVDNLNDVFSQTNQIANLANTCYDGNFESWGLLADMSAPMFDEDGNLVHGGIINEDESGYYGVGAEQAEYRRATYGSNIQCDFNISMNVSDQFFFGLALGVYNIDYNRESLYGEIGTDGNYYSLSNWYQTTGDGIDVKFGFICRPIADSPFRFGINIHTPIWYSLRDQNGAYLSSNGNYISSGDGGVFDYSYRTPWVFGLSVGHTIGTNFAIGAEYEYSDYSTSKYTTDDGYEDAYFRQINDNTKRFLQGVSTFKIGMEYKPIDAFSVRLGYNYVSAPMKSDSYRIIAADSPFTETDFTNWKAINRITFGFGYRYKVGYIDFAYQYSAQKGDFYAFDEVNLKPTEISNNRSQFMCTLGFKF